jgi:hypothetical protein
LSQSTGTGAFDGQHGISLAISSAMPDAAMSVAACTESELVAAITGRDTGATARPAIIKTASSRRMVKLRVTELDFHGLPAMESLAILILITIQPASGKPARTALVRRQRDLVSFRAMIRINAVDGQAAIPIGSRVDADGVR